MKLRIPLATVLVCTVVTACGDSGPSDFDAQPLADAVEDELDDADFDDDGAAELRDCVVDDWDDIVDDTLADFDDDVVDDALDGERTTTAFEYSSGDYVDCAYVSDDGTAVVGLFVLETPRDVDDYPEDFAGDDSDVDVDESVDYRGGTFRHVCVTYDDDVSDPYCQVEWFDDDVLLGLYVFGPDADDIDTDDLEAAFTPQFDRIVEQFDE